MRILKIILHPPETCLVLPSNMVFYNRIGQITYSTAGSTTGNQSSKYEHRRTSALLRNLKYKDARYGKKKTYRFRNLPK